MTSEAFKTFLCGTSSGGARIADGMAFAATPLFAMMAVASFADDGSAVMCGGVPGGALPGSMAPCTPS